METLNIPFGASWHMGFIPECAENLRQAHRWANARKTCAKLTGGRYNRVAAVDTEERRDTLAGGDNVKRNFARQLVGGMTIAAGLLAGSTILAHHGAANVYDVSKPVVMKGTITKFEWTNPHNQIYFDVVDQNGTVTHWIVATEPPQVMLERGWTRKSVPIGDQATFYVFVAKNGAPVGNLQKIVLSNGTELTAAPAPAGAGPAAPAAAR